jgi:F-type H+-transporting ATPase subunit delta
VSAITNRYARVFANIVLEKRLDRPKTAQDLALFAQLIQHSHELRSVWQNPSVEAAQKRKVLDRIVARVDASKMVRNLIAVLIDRGRIAALAEIAHAVEWELNRRMGLIQAEVTTAHPLSKLDKSALESRVREVTGKQVLAQYTTNASLLAGAVVKVDSTVYDGSLRRRLEKLRQQLSNN